MAKTLGMEGGFMAFKKKSNKALGNDTEKQFAQYMYAKGWWVHIFSYNTSGQPCDIVMSRDNMVWFLDVKNVEGDRFDFTRVEPNQMTAFELLISRGTSNVGFAIKFKDHGWFLLDFKKMLLLKDLGVKDVYYHGLIKI